MERKRNHLVVTLQQFPVVDLRVDKDQNALRLYLRLNFLFFFFILHTGAHNLMAPQSSLIQNGAVSQAGFPFQSNSACIHLSLP